MGPSKAKNAGIVLATGHYLLFVDADDFLEPDMVRHMYDQLDTFGGDLAICGYRRISFNQQGSRTMLVHLADKVYDEGIPFPDFIELYRMPLLNQNWNKMYRTDIIRNHSISFINSLSLGEDLLFNLRYLRHSKKVTVLDSCHYNFIYGNINSLSNIYRHDLFDLQQSIYDSVMEYIMEQYPSRDSNSLDTLERCHAVTIASCIATICKTRNVNLKEKYRDIYRVVRNPAVLKIMKAQKGQGFKNRILYRLISMKQVFLLMMIFHD
jgi:glycosyltransferase involved in cell wall biosynthesis